jgi:hypothetical protein
MADAARRFGPRDQGPNQQAEHGFADQRAASSALAAVQQPAEQAMPQLSAGAHRLNFDLFLTMEQQGTAVRSAIFAGHARP